MNWSPSNKIFIIVLAALLSPIMVFSQGGNDCNSALANPIQLPFFTNNQTLCGDLNDYNGANSCLANTVNGTPFGGQDWIYAVTPNQTGFLSLILNDVHSTGNVRQILAVFQGCVGIGNCLTTLTGSGTNGISTIVPVSAGLTYYILVDASSSSNSNSTNCFQYDLTANLTPVPVQPACSNMSFENGNLSSWIATTGNSIMAPLGSPTPIYQLTAIGVSPGRHTVVNSGADPCGGFPRVDPLGGASSLLIGNNNVGAEAEQISQTFLVGASNSSFTYRYAVVFEDPGHSSAEQPFFIARLRDQNGIVIPCSEFIVSAAAELPGFFNSTVCTGVKYKPWSTVNVDLSNYLGQNVTAEFTVGDCSQGGHFGYAYVDAACSPSTLAALADTICPGESVTLTAPTGYESYTWNPGNITSQSTIVSPLVTTNYTLSLTAYNGCVSNVQIPITIAPLPVPVIQYQAPACDLPVLVQSLSTISNGTIANQQWNLGSSSSPSSSTLTNITSIFTGPGTYPITLQLTSDQGCTANAASSIIVPPCVFHIAITGDTICPGQCLSFPVQLSYGTPPYTYLWSNGSTASQINLCSNQSNIISLTVTDADGFIATDTAMITVAPHIVFESSSTDVLCSNQTNATIFPNAQGWGPFTYTWSNGQTSSSLSGIAAGNYSLVVIDNFGCSVDTTFIITQPDPLFATLSAQPATCNQSNGVVNVNPPEGGTFPYEYSIDGGVFSSFAQFGGLSVGSHAVQVRDANGCIVNLTATITMLSYPTQLSMNLTDATCGADNGVISPLQVLGGIAPFNLWVNGTNMGIVSMPISFDSLYAGDWNVELSDAHGCMVDTNVTLLQMGAPTAITFSSQPSTCSLSNASLLIAGASGGTPAYSYSFNGSSYTNQLNYPNLPSGDVTISVMDQNQCVFDTTVSISFIADVEVSTILLQNVQCAGGNDGQSAAIINSGTAPFQFVWTNGDNDSLATTLQAGTWSVFVTDAHNCRDTAQVLIGQPQALQLLIDHSNPVCGISNGEISVDTVYGGTAPYNFRLNGGPIQSISNFSNLSVGTYTLQTIDSHGCSAAQQTLLTMPSIPTVLSLSTVNAVCGLPNGEAHLVQIAGGVGPFQVQWIDNTIQTIESFPYIRTGLNAGSFPIHVFDSNGCMVDTNVTLLQIGAPTAISFSTQPATCSLSNASLLITGASGGTPAYTYSFNGGAFTNQLNYPNLPVGNVSIGVMDQNQCVFDTITNISFIADVEVSTNLLQNVQCAGGNDGQSAAIINSGTAPFQFVWTNGDNDSLATALQAGTWSVYITDANNCRDTAQVLIGQPPALQLSINHSNPVCGISNGEISVDTVYGGTAPYNFRLNGGPIQTTSNFTNLSVGTYTLQTIDSHGCSAAQQTLLTMPSFPTLLTLSTVDAVCGLPNGEAHLVQIAGGVGPFQVQWIDNTIQTIESFPYIRTGLNAGSFPIHVFDANGCSLDSMVALIQIPGPSQMNVTVQVATCNLTNASLAVQSVNGGTAAYQYSFNYGNFGSQHQFNNLDAGTYSIAVRDLNGCIIDTALQVSEIPLVEIDPFITHPITCYGYNDGALQADLNQGTAPYSVTWVNGQSGINAENLIAGTYQVNVTDANGCFQAATIVLPQPDPVQIVISGSDYVCDGEEIQLIAEASGGTSHTNIVWPGFSTEGDTLIDNPTISRIYSAIATDIFGCAAVDSHAVLLRELPQGNITADVVQGCSPVCVNFSMNSTGTSALQSYIWNFTNGENGLGQMQNICFTESGSQDATVSLTDVYGCSTILVSEGIVEVYPLPEARFSYNPQNADILNPEYHFVQESELAHLYRWDFGDGTISTQESPTHVFPDTGQFNACLRVTSLHGCIDELCKSIEINPYPTIYAPNAFTPNGDGTNELFLVKVTYAKKFLLEIFNRWGELIYEGTDPLEGWNGEYLGNPCQEDVYVWRATVTNSEDLAKQLIGRVTLID